MSDPAAAEAVIDQPIERRVADRRRGNALLSHWTYGFRGRRRAPRRASDRRGGAVVVDHYDCSLLVLALAVFVLSSCDAAFTLHLLEHGLVEEANPLMRALILFDVDLFVGAKLLVTGLGVIGLVAFSELHLLGRLPLNRVLGALATFYLCLIGYEITLLSTL